MKKPFNQTAYPAACAFALAALLASIGVASASDAPAPQTRMMLAAADTATVPAATPSAVAADKRVEARIKDLHIRLGITAAQEGAWENVAGAMRDSANTMIALIQARTDNAQTMTAVDDLKSYAQIAQAHADSLQKFTPVFGTLYDSMSDPQKKNADLIFRAHSRKAFKHMSAKVG
jgi:hypothetical protein